MLPERLKYLDRFERFLGVLVEQAKQDKIKERDFYALIKAKAKTMDQERREEMSKITTVKVIGAKKNDLRY